MSEFTAAGDSRYVVTDLASFDADPINNPGARGQILLNVFRWDKDAVPLVGAWVHAASVGSPVPSGITTPPGNSFAVTVVQHPANERIAAFVGHNRGVCVFDMEGLKSTGSTIGPLAFAKNVTTDYWVSALVVVEDRLFFIENGVPVNWVDTDPPPASLRLHGYQWIFTGPNQVSDLVKVSEVTLESALNPFSSPQHPGNNIRGRVRKLATSTPPYPDRHVYFAGLPHMTQWRWPSLAGGPTNPDPNHLDLIGYWRSDYDEWLQDCRIYDFTFAGQTGKYVLACKDREAFAIVGPIP
jgi:hypothetical protein